MKLSRAIRIVGFEINVDCNKDPLPNGVTQFRHHWRAWGNHPHYGYAVYGYDLEEQKAIARCVEDNYRKISQVVFREQGWRCLHCGLLKPLTADHIKMRGANGREDHRPNLRGLCMPCHKYRHHKGGKDWQPRYTIEHLRGIIEDQG